MWRLVHRWSFLLFWLYFDCFWLFLTIDTLMVHCWHSLGRPVTIGTLMVIFAILTVFWLFIYCLWPLVHRWYTVGTVLVDLWRLVQQWFWVFLTIGTVYKSSRTVKRQWNSKKWPLVYKSSHVYTESAECTKPRKLRYLARPPSHVPGQWPQPVARGQGWLYVSTWTSMRLAPVRCRVLLHSLLPIDDACSSSSLSTTVIKFSIFSDSTRKLFALPPELRRIR